MMPDAMDADMHPVQHALAAIRSGSFAVVVDDFDRENEGDLIGACSHATKSSLALMLRHTTGIVCVAVTPSRAEELRLPLMVAHHNEDPYRTAFTVTIDYRHGTTTGVSASDRAATIRAVADERTQPVDFTRPGHVFPLLAQSAGVLARGGHTEATVDLVHLSGAGTAGYLCEIYDHASGDMVRLPGLVALARALALPLVSIADIQRYRYRREVLVQAVPGASCGSPSLPLASLHPVRQWRSLYGPNTYRVYRGQGGGGRLAVWFMAAAALMHAGQGSSCSQHAAALEACTSSLRSYARALVASWQEEGGGMLIVVEGAPWENVQGKDAAHIGKLRGDGAFPAQPISPQACELCPLLPARPPGQGVPRSAHAVLYRPQGEGGKELEKSIQEAEKATGMPCSVVCDRVSAELGQVVRAEVAAGWGGGQGGETGHAAPMYDAKDSVQDEESLFKVHASSWPSVELLYVPSSGQPLPSLWQYGVRVRDVLHTPAAV